MTEHGFFAGMFRLEKVYGEKAYPGERKDIISRKLNMLDDNEWSDVVTEMIGSSKFAPMVDELLEAAKPIIQQKRFNQTEMLKAQIEKRRDQNKTCHVCDDSGALMAVKKDTNLSYAFRCPEYACITSGIFFGRNIPAWSENVSRLYSRVRKGEIILAVCNQEIENMNSKKLLLIIGDKSL